MTIIWLSLLTVSLIVVISVVGSLSLRLKMLEQSGIPKQVPSVTPEHSSQHQPDLTLSLLTVAVEIEQDFSAPTFRNKLVQALEKEDARVKIISAGEVHAADAVISGKVLCNNYPDVYFEADFVIDFPRWPSETVRSRPIHGGRQDNLCLTLINTLRQTIEYRRDLEARQSALEELR